MGIPELTEAAREHLAKEGYDPTYGARPVKRAIQREILDPLSLQLLEGKFHEGDQITADVSSSGHLEFRS